MPAMSGAMAAAAAAPVNLPVTFVYLDVSGDPTWVWTGAWDVTVPSIAADPLLSTSRTFLAGAHIGAVSGVTHAADGSVAQIRLDLLYADFTDPATAAFVSGPSLWSRRAAVVWAGFLDTASFALIADPVRVLTGQMTAVAAADGKAPGISLTLATRAGAMGVRANGWVLSDAHQQAFWPGDTALQYVPQLAGKELRFGSPDDKVSRGSSGGGGGAGRASLRQAAV